MRPRLNVGCGLSPRREGQINADLYAGENVDLVFDAAKPWPFRENAISIITGNHVLEHISDPWAFFAEAWRVLAPSKDCNLQLWLPYGLSEAGFGDLSHVRQWVPGSFCCFQPGYHEAVSNPQHKNWRYPFSVLSIYLRVDPALRWLLKPLIRLWGLRIIPFLAGAYVEIIVGLRALKLLPEQLRWKMEHKANEVPIAYCMYQHEYEGRDLYSAERMRLLFFGKGARHLQRLYDAYYG